jgi:hypothetical protein
MSASCKLKGFAGLTAVLLLGATEVRQCGSFFTPDGKCFKRLTQDAGFQSVPLVCRNETGTKLFLIGRTPDGKSLVEIVSSDGVRFKRFECGRPVLRDDDQMVCCVTNHRALRFANGEEIPYRFTNDPPVRFEYSPSGTYVLFDRSDKPATMPLGWKSAPQLVAFLTPSATNMGDYTPHWVGVLCSTEPTKALFRLPNDFYAYNIFARADQIAIFGYKFVFGADGKPGRPGLEKDKAWGLVFSQDGPGYKLSGQLDLSRFNSVLDLDPATGTLLVRTKGEMFAKWGLFVPDSGKYTSLGSAGAYGFFLDPRFCKYLEGVRAKGVEVEKGEPDGAANRSQPVSAETNRVSAAAGSGR